MKILAISGSGRNERMTHNTLKKLLENCSDIFEIVSLVGKRINGCNGCTTCATDNQCKVKDDWNEIGEKMKEADIIIFGAPNYFGTINSLSHATLERTFAFRHRSVYPLRDKLGVIVTTCESRANEDPVAAYIKRMFDNNHMVTIGSMQVNQYNQCYTCGYGHDCVEGIVVRKNGILKEILPCHFPLEVDFQEQTLKEIKNIRSILKNNGVKFND